MYYTAKLHPNSDKQNMLFAGCADKKVYQWDANSGDLVQVRNMGLGLGFGVMLTRSLGLQQAATPATSSRCAD